MKATRYYVLDMTTKFHVGGCKAKSPEEAAMLAKEFGENCIARTLSSVKGTWKDEGSELFWVRDSQYGRKYKCKICMKENLGLGQYNHWTQCPMHADHSVIRRG